MSIHQLFRVQVIPFYNAAVRVTTVLTLTHDHLGLGRSLNEPGNEIAKSGRPQYYIQSQNDLYQTNEFIKFIMPWGIGTSGVLLWGFFATLCCVVGALLLAPVTWVEEWIAVRDTSHQSRDHVVIDFEGRPSERNHAISPPQSP